jgi:hypothetical protein
MPKIEILPPDGQDASGPHTPYGTVVKVDGREIDDVCSVQIDMSVDNAVTARLGVLVTASFHFTGAVDLHVTACVPPGYRLIEEENADGTTSYRAEVES